MSASLNTQSKHIEKTQKQLWVIAIIILIATSLRGIRMPNLWAYTQYLIDYDFGFVRRGIIGFLTGIPESALIKSYSFFSICSFAVLIINLVLLGVVAKRMINIRDIRATVATFIYISGSGVIYLNHTIGYSDQLGLLATLICCLATGFTRRFVLAAMMFPALMLIHEGLFVIFYPVAVIAMLMSVDPKQAEKPLAGILMLSILLLGLFFFITAQRLAPVDSPLMYQSHQVIATMPLREDVYQFLSQSSFEAAAMMVKVWGEPSRIIGCFLLIFWTLPLVYIINRYSWQVLTQINATKLLKIMCLLAGLAPLVLNLIAFDHVRWATLSITASFLVAYLIFETHQSGFKKRKDVRRFLPLLVIVVFFNANSHVFLMDEVRVVNFPYPEHLFYWIEVLSGQATFPQVPKY